MHFMKECENIEKVLNFHRDFQCGMVKKMSGNDKEWSEASLENVYIPLVSGDNYEEKKVAFVKLKDYIEKRALELRKRTMENTDLLDKLFGK